MIFLTGVPDDNSTYWFFFCYVYSMCRPYLLQIVLLRQAVLLLLREHILARLMALQIQYSEK